MTRWTLALLTLICCTGCASDELYPMPIAELRDRARGAWAGKMIGVSYGAPTEFRYCEQVVPEDRLIHWTDDAVRDSLRQDDLYVQITLAKTLDDHGLGATADDFGTAFAASQYPLWHGNLAARRALRRGVPASLSGTPAHNAHGPDIDFQIESDFIGLISPAMPAASNQLCARAGAMIGHGDGVYGGMFVAAMYSAAYVSTDPHSVVESGLASLPADSTYAAVIRDVLAWHRQESDWQVTWRRVNDKWGRQDLCPHGALAPLNIDATINGAYVAIGLLYGNDDFERSMGIATRCGQDSDCNPSTVCGIWGAMHGYDAIPEPWRRGIPRIAADKFLYTDHCLDSITDWTVRQARAMTLANGGRADDTCLYIRPQPATPVRLTTHPDPGTPSERITTNDPRWRFTGNWTKDGTARRASDQGATAQITFEGTGALLVGPYLPGGGTADVYLDEKLDRTIDTWSDDDRRVGHEAVWWKWNLPPGPHTLRLVLRGQRFANSSGTEIRLTDLLVYRPTESGK